jgi:MFS family permease
VLKHDSILRAFAHKNYRLFWSGQAVSLLGTWMQRVAMGWLVYRLTDSAFMLGMVEFIGQMPAFILAPVAGVYLDRWDRRRTLIVTQLLLMIQALAMAILIFGGWIRMGHVLLLSVVFGLINAFDQAGRQTFLKDIVDNPEDIGNAIALNSTMFNAGRLIGPSIAGIIIALAGEGWCFLLNSLSFVAILISLIKIRVAPSTVPAAAQSGVFASLREGVHYAYSVFPIRVILLVLTMFSLIGLPFTVLLPVFARDVFHGNAVTLGFLTAASGVGALYGAYYLAGRRTVLGLERVILVALVSTATAFLLVAIFQLLYPSLLFIVFAGFGLMAVFSSGNTILQSIVADDKRGRVLSLYTMTYHGMTPLGSLAAGFITNHSTAPFTLFLSGCLLMAGGLFYSRYLKRMRLYIRQHKPLYESTHH